MKPLLTTLSVLTLAITTGNISNILHTTLQKNNIITNNIVAKTQQDTIYIDKFGNEVTTNEKDLSNINSKEVTQIGFYQNEKGKIEVVQMPAEIEKVPNQLPPEITSLRKMFYGTKKFNQDISQWNTSNVTNMSETFGGATEFNQNLSSWDTSKVTDMSGMFGGAEKFNQDISKWNTSNVTNMSYTFIGNHQFNQDISQWNTANVGSMTAMFFNAILFNQDISKWDTRNVTDMSAMFFNAKKFSQNLSQ